MSDINDVTAKPKQAMPTIPRTWGKRILWVVLMLAGVSILLMLFVGSVKLLNTAIRMVENFEDLDVRIELVLQSVDAGRAGSSATPPFSYMPPKQIDFDMVMTANIQGRKPKSIVDKFSRNKDTWIIPHFTFRNVIGRHLVMVKWYVPDGNFYEREVFEIYYREEKT